MINCAANREFGDSVQTCRCDFDSHDKQKCETGGNRGLVDVPYRCFLPKGLEGVLVVGRTASFGHLTNSAFRRMENAFQSGEVRGTAAGMAAAAGTTPRRLAVTELQAEVHRNGFRTSQARIRQAG